MSTRAEVLSIHVGRVRSFRTPEGRTWRSAIDKAAVEGPVFLSTEGPAGNEVADHRHHGGPQQAVLAYPVEHYAAWRSELELEAGPGGFGENLSLRGLTEGEACIGDTFELGTALLQVSQPRQPCGTLVRRWGRDEVLPRAWDAARTGWYLRVLREGSVEAGQCLTLLERPHPGWTVARLLKLRRGQDPGDRAAAAALEHLSPAWRAWLVAP